MRNFFVFALLLLCPLATGVSSSYECEVVETDTDAELENAGVNPTCPGSKQPWACYCELEEECENEEGDVLTFHRRVLLGCGQLSDCMRFAPFGKRCAAMED